MDWLTGMRRFNNKYYEIFEPTIDKQHLELLNILAKFVRAIESRSKGTEIENMIKFLEKYIQEHFAYEEAEMIRLDCPSREDNVREHRSFMQKLLSFKNELEENGASLELASRIHLELYMWFIGHIGRTDKYISECLGKKARMTQVKPIERTTENVVSSPFKTLHQRKTANAPVNPR